MELGACCAAADDAEGGDQGRHHDRAHEADAGGQEGGQAQGRGEGRGPPRQAAAQGQVDAACHFIIIVYRAQSYHLYSRHSIFI